MSAHQVEVVRQEHGTVRALRYRAECTCGWIGGLCDHPATADADGADHLRETGGPGRVLDAAIAIAAYPPRTQGQYVSNAGVYWPLIHELRAALDELGVEWRRS